MSSEPRNKAPQYKMLVSLFPAFHASHFNSQNCKLTVSCCTYRQMAELKKDHHAQTIQTDQDWSFAENKFTKYLLYAVGEIILVVIGILIALSINNRNDFQKGQAGRKAPPRKSGQRSGEGSAGTQYDHGSEYGYLAIIDTVLYNITSDEVYELGDFVRHMISFPFSAPSRSPKAHMWRHCHPESCPSSE